MNQDSHLLGATIFVGVVTMASCTMDFDEFCGMMMSK